MSVSQILVGQTVDAVRSMANLPASVCPNSKEILQRNHANCHKILAIHHHVVQIHCVPCLTTASLSAHVSADTSKARTLSVGVSNQGILANRTHVALERFVILRGILYAIVRRE